MNNALVNYSKKILENIDQYEVVNIDEECYKCVICKYYITFKHKDDTIVVLMDVIDIHEICVLKNIAIPQHIYNAYNSYQMNDKKKSSGYGCC